MTIGKTLIKGISDQEPFKRENAADILCFSVLETSVYYDNEYVFTYILWCPKWKIN